MNHFFSHLVKKTYSEPFYHVKSGQVMAKERQTLYGLTILEGKQVAYGSIATMEARNVFIQQALVEGRYTGKGRFSQHNKNLVIELQELEDRFRRRDLLVEQSIIFNFYDNVIPESIYNLPAFEKWRKKRELQNSKLLYLNRDQLLLRGLSKDEEAQFPKIISFDDFEYSLQYHFQPGHEEDGVTLMIPIALLHQLPRYLFECISILLIISLSLLFFYDNDLKYNSFSYLATFALGAQKILPLIQTIYRMISNIRAKKFEVIDIIRMMNSKVSTKNRTKEIYNFKNSILLKNIDFSYENNIKILKKVNLNINKGDKVGIVGSTGSGKSTLLDIIMGLLEPSNGEIFVDDVNITSYRNKYKMNKWRTCISHVPQNIFIADASFAENIAFGLYEDQIDMGKVRECSRKAMIEDLILNSDKKYKTNLGEGGVKLSGGQKQRIGIARALYKNSQILVLDEATSALDNKTEKDVMKTIKNLTQMTILIVTHRPSTIKYCDKVIKIENGHIINS